MLPDQSCEGWVTHRRQVPITHEFRYRVWMLHVDVDNLARVGRVSRWLATDSPGLVQLRTRDYLTHARGTLRERVTATVTAAGHAEPRGRITLLTQPRNLGTSFNPVSFFFCHHPGGGIRTVVAEINNTPWNERHCYVLSADQAGPRAHFEFQKMFHVSPFNDMDMRYRWTFEIGERIHIRMVLERADEEIFRAGLHLKAVALTAQSVSRGFRHHPAQNLTTLARIYGQAFRLWRKRTPFYEHPDKRESDDERHDISSAA